MPDRCTILIHDLDDARAAARAATEASLAVTLRTAPGAAGHAGVGWFRALTDALRVELPAATRETVPLVLDCADAAGRAMEAIREGVEAIRFTGSPGTAAKLAAMCDQSGIGFEDGNNVDSTEAVLDLRDTADAESAIGDFLAGFCAD